MIQEEPRFVVAGHGNPLLEKRCGATDQSPRRYALDLRPHTGRHAADDDAGRPCGIRPTCRNASPPWTTCSPTTAVGRARFASYTSSWSAGFDGNPLNLHRETSLQQAQRMARLLGGEEALAAKAQEAAQAGDPLGAAQLAQHLLRLQPQRMEAKRMLADALEALAQDTLKHAHAQTTPSPTPCSCGRKSCSRNEVPRSRADCAAAAGNYEKLVLWLRIRESTFFYEAKDGLNMRKSLLLAVLIGCALAPFGLAQEGPAGQAPHRSQIPAKSHPRRTGRQGFPLAV